jgi:hypothetical protein
LPTKPRAERDGFGEGEQHGRRPDGTAVCFICLEDQLAAVPAEVTVYVVGGESTWLRFNKRKLIRLAA